MCSQTHRFFPLVPLSFHIFYLILLQPIFPSPLSSLIFLFTGYNTKAKVYLYWLCSSQKDSLLSVLNFVLVLKDSWLHYFDILWFCLGFSLILRLSSFWLSSSWLAEGNFPIFVSFTRPNSELLTKYNIKELFSFLIEYIPVLYIIFKAQLPSLNQLNDWISQFGWDSSNLEHLGRKKRLPRKCCSEQLTVWALRGCLCHWEL